MKAKRKLCDVSAGRRPAEGTSFLSPGIESRVWSSLLFLPLAKGHGDRKSRRGRVEAAEEARSVSGGAWATRTTGRSERLVLISSSRFVPEDLEIHHPLKIALAF